MYPSNDIGASAYMQEFAEPQNIPAVSAAIDDLTRAGGRLSELMAKLDARLAPVLSPPQPVAGENVKAPAYSVEVAQRIHREAVQLNDISVHLSGLLSRLEV